VIVTDADNLERMPVDLVEEVIVLDENLLVGVDDSFETVDTSSDDPAQLYYTSGTTGLAKGSSMPIGTCWPHEEFDYCHDIRDGEIFHGMGEWAWAAGITPCSALGATERLSSSISEREGSTPRSSLRRSPETT